MSKFNDDVVNFSNNFNEFINTFENLDDKAPFDNNLLKAIRAIYNSAIESNRKLLENLDSDLSLYNKEFKNKLNEYYSKIDVLKDEIEKKIVAIEEKFKDSSLEIKKEIQKINDENKRKKENHELDIEYFISSSDQNINMFELEHEENITRYNYQAENALQTYQNSIAKNNSILEQKLNKINTDFEFSLVDYDNETKNILDGYNKKIESLNQIVANKVKDFSLVQASHKEKKYNESVDLNNQIRKLVNETNKKNIAERTTYQNNQNTNQREKDQRRANYQAESQSISRDFVFNMTRLDDTIAQIKNDYNNNLEKEHKELHYKLLEIHKEQDKTLTSIVNSDNTERNIKRQLRQKNKSYYTYTELEKNQSSKTVNHLKKSFFLDNEKNSYSKKLLELNRSYAIKLLNENELHDNKYYQELNNLSENDLNYKLTLLTNEYNKAANLIRLSSTIKTIDIDKNFEKQDALHQIDMEKVITDIKKIKLDYSAVETMHSYLHTLQDTKHQKSLNHSVVHNLLEIEKNKVLSEFNQRLYELNVQKEDELLKYSTVNIKLKNYKYKQLKYAEMATERAILQNDIYTLNYKDTLDKYRMENEITTETVNNQYEQDYLATNILNKRYKQEIKAINQIIMSYIILIRELESNTVKILDTIFDYIIFRPEYLDIIKSFIDKLVKMVYDFFSSLSDTFIESEKKIVDDRVQFEESFKYKGFYDEIESGYEEKHSSLIEKKNEIEDALHNCQTKINDYNSLIFTIQNQIIYIKDPKNYVLYDKQSAKKNLGILTNKIETLSAEANDYIAKLEPLKSDLQIFENKIKQLDEEHNSKIAELRRTQYYSALSFHKLLEDLTYAVGTYKKELYSCAFQSKESNLNAVNYESVINKKKNLILSIDNRLINNLYSIVNNFFYGSTAEYKNSVTNLEIAYKKKLEEVNYEYNSILNSEKMRSSKIRRALNNNIKRKNLYYTKLEKKCDNIIKSHNNKHGKISNDIISRTSNATQKFYNEFYAICANQKSIDDEFLNTIKELDYTYDVDVKALVKTSMDKKTKLDNDLQAYINKRHIIIKDIPEKTKTEKFNTNEEIKHHNEEIDKNTAQAKVNYLEKRKELNNNIAEINVTFGKNKMEINNEHKMQLKREKKNHNIQLRHQPKFKSKLA